MRDLLELHQTDDTFGRLAEFQELVQPILTELAQACGCDRAFVALVDAEQRVVQGAVGVGVPDELLERLRAPVDEPGLLVKALLLGAPILVEDVRRDPRVPERLRAQYEQLGMLAFAAIPLPPASGVLVVSKAGRPIGESDLDDLRPFAGRLVAAMAEHPVERRQCVADELHAVEKDWLWWMLNTVPDPVLLTDEQNGILLQNVHAERLFRADPADSPGKRRAVELNNLLLFAELSSRARDRSGAVSRELTLVDPIEGDELLFEVICRPATNLRTGQRALISVLRDVTDLRRAGDELKRSLADLQRAGEEALRERDQLTLILENVADPIVVTDPTSRIILLNPPAERLLQPRRREGLEPRESIYRANGATLTSFLSQLRLDASVVLRGEIQLVDPETGEPLTMSVTATEIRDALGQVSAVVSVLHDLTGIRELERRRIEQQLFESEKLAAVGRLAATVAHEINNPLEAIKNALYLLVTRTPEDDRNRPFLEIASKETDRVSGVIRQMLGFYRPEATRVPTDVNEVLSESLALLERHFRQHRVTVVCDLDRSLPSVIASGDQLRQVFLNLFLNAQEAMPGGGELHVVTQALREADGELLAGRYVLIQVHDTGVGIAEEDLRRIFEPFFSTKRDQRGTGLGLWVSQGIVRQHGGQIKVRSWPGRGTTFTIALPVGAQDG